MIHYNYVSGTLSSPQGRKANGSSNGIDYARYDVSLSYDPNDTGTYIVQSLSSVYCTGAQAWIVWNAFTEAQVSDAFPINFTQNGSESDSDGELYFLYQWQSSSGNPADIASCQVGEFVTYPGYTPGQNLWYWWQSPPWQPTKTHNPTQNQVAGNNSSCSQGNLNGVAPCQIDNQEHSSFVAPPTVGYSFAAQQKWWYACPNVNGGNSVDLTTFTTIQRSVTNSGSTYTYQVTKSSASASCILGQNCAGP